MIEKIKKNNKKRNLNIAVATIAGFLLSSGMTYGKIINIENPVTENTTYTDEKTILNADPLDNGVIIKDKSTPNDMIITAKDLTINQTVTKEGGKYSLGTISLEDGKLDINVDKLNINSDFTKNNGTSLTGISVSGSEDTTGTLLLNAKEDININITKTGAESISDLGTGINVYSHGDMEINSKNLNIAVEITDSFYSAGIHNEGKIAIKTDNIKIDAKSDGEIYGIYNYDPSPEISTFEINNNDLIEINVTGDIGVAILNVGGNTTINSGNTILSATSAANGNTRTYGIDSLDGNVEINGGLEIKTRSEHDKNDIAVSSKNGTVNLNKDNDAVAVKIEGKLDAREASRINLNLNGSDSYLLGGTLLNDTGEINLGVANNAVWKNEGDSTVTSLNFNNGIIDMTHESGKQTIEIKEISGNNGRIVMDISPEGSQTDYIKINKGLTDQTHHIETGEESILSLKDYDFSEKILIGETAKNVNLKGSNFTDIKNIFDYSLDLESQEDGKDPSKNNWYVTGMEKKEGAAVEGVMDDLSLQYMNAELARVEADMIHKRLGDIRDSKEGAGTWAKVVSGQVESDKNGYFKNDYTMIQAGVDKTETTATGTWTTGFAVQRKEGKADFRNGDGENESTGVALYKSWVGSDDKYLSLVGKFSHLKNEYKSYNVKNEKMEANYHTNAGTLSLEYGKRLAKDNWYVQPHAQMTYTWIDGKNYNTSSNIRVEQKDINSLIGKVGVYAGRDFKKSSHYVKAGVLHEFKGEYGATIKGADTTISKNMEGKDTWIEIGVGGNVKVGKTDSMNVYYEVGKTFGGDFETNWQATVGMKYKF